MDRIKFIIIIIESVVLISLSGYRIYEYVNKKYEMNPNNPSENFKTYKVTFDYGDNTVKSIDIKENKKIEFPNEPIRDGYIFDGWLLNNVVVDNNYEVKEDITLKANWINENIDSEIKILVYEINIRQEADVSSADLGDVYMDQVYEVLDIVETDIYTWYKIKKDNIVGYVANQNGEEWVEYNNLKKYIVSFYADDTLVKKIKVDEGARGYDFINDIEAPIKNGYVFKGWKNNEIDNYTEIKKDISYNAEYSKVYRLILIYDEFYTRIVDLDEQQFKGKQRMAVTTDDYFFGLDPYEYVYDDFGRRTKKTMKDGYEFIGWYTESGEKFEWYIPETDKLTLIAKYEKTNDDSYLSQYRKFETNELSAELIYELEQKILIMENVGFCGKGSFPYFDRIGKTEEYSMQDKIVNIIHMISPYVKCDEYDYIYNGNAFKTGCYISEGAVENLYKYVYGNDSYYDLVIKDFPLLMGIPMYEYDDSKNAYFKSVYHFGTCDMYSSIIEIITDVKKNNDAIEITKKSIYSSRNPMNTTEVNYDYDERPRKDYDGKQLPEYNSFEEIQDKLDSYVFVFKKDSKNNYYLFEVKKQENNF